MVAMDNGPQKDEYKACFQLKLLAPAGICLSNV
jgi:hypothetical protein